MNKTLIITVGSKGIGRSIAIKFAHNNFDIYTCSRNEDELKKLEHDINSINSKIKVHTLKSDLSTKEGSLNLNEGFGVQLSVNSVSILNKIGFDQFNKNEKYYPNPRSCQRGLYGRKD